MEIIRRFRHQSFDERHDNVMLDIADDGMRIEILRLGAIADVQNLIAIASLDTRLMFATAGQKRKHGQRAETKNQSAQRESAEFKLHYVFRQLRNGDSSKKATGQFSSAVLNLEHGTRL